MSNKVAGYIRVSTQEQAREGLSLDAQEASIRAYCAMKKLDLVDIVIDAGVSAGKRLETRHGGSRLQRLLPEISGVVSYKLDRLFRDCADCLDVAAGWDDDAVALHLVDLGGQTIDTSSAMGRFFLTIMAGAAELERNLIGERTKGALEHAKSQGATLGRVGLGQRRIDDRDQHGRRRVVADPAEQATVSRLVELRAAGRTFAQVAGQLTAEGRRTKRGGQWYASTVRNVLQRLGCTRVRQARAYQSRQPRPLAPAAPAEISAVAQAAAA